MYFPFCLSNRQARKKGKLVDRQDPQQQHGQARATLNFIPTSEGQVETERLLSGDPNAVDDLKSLLIRAEKRSRQAPRLNLNVQATDKLLQGNPDAIEELLEEQRLAQMRVKNAAGRQWLGPSLMRNSSLVGESFEHSCRQWCGDKLSSSTELKGQSKCRGHLEIHYCSDSEGYSAQNPQKFTSCGQSFAAAEDAEGQKTTPPVPDADDQDDQEFSFEDHFADEEDYQHALQEVTAFTVTPVRARSIFIPARTTSLRRKRGHGSLRESSNVIHSAVTPSERWLIQGFHKSLLDDQREEVPDGDNMQGVLGARRSVRLSMIAGPLSGPPAAPLPPCPPVLGPLRHSWPLTPTVKEAVPRASSISLQVGR